MKRHLYWLVPVSLTCWCVSAHADLRVVPAWIGPDRCDSAIGVPKGTVTVEREQIKFASTNWSEPVPLVCPRGFQVQRNTLQFTSETGASDAACESLPGNQLDVLRVHCHKTQPLECGSLSAECRSLAEVTCAAVSLDAASPVDAQCRSLGALAQEGILAAMVEAVNLLERVSKTLEGLQSGKALLVPEAGSAPEVGSGEGGITQNSVPATAVESTPQEQKFPGKSKKKQK